MPERRTETRAGSSDRRDILRPPLWFNCLLLCFAAAMTFYAGRQRARIDADFTKAFDGSTSGPSELNQITAELAEMDLALGALEKELEGRLAGIESLKSRDLYLSIDTAKKTLTLKSGNEILRTANVRLGAPAAALKGAFAVAGKTGGPGGRVILLPNDRVIRAKPGSFTASEADLEAIWDQITPETRVYVF